MQIVSYRGPSQPGGVASLIQRAQRWADHTWWHMYGDHLQTMTSSSLSRVATIPRSITSAHYRYCNEFIWPVMHGLFDLSHFSESDLNAYRSFNMAVAANINLFRKPEPLFIHDYQFAVLAGYLPHAQASRSISFWHIPWPEAVPDHALSAIVEVARGLLHCRSIGFHTIEYVENFAEFVREHVSDVIVTPDSKRVIHRTGDITDLIVSPAGIDYSYWEQQAKMSSAMPPCSSKYILSVDRADYTKGVAERIEAVRHLFAWRPELREKFQFVFVCQQTRPGIAPYDEYWSRCRSAYEDAMSELATQSWSPIIWLTEPIASEDLAGWYAKASAMLITPLKDGLNLTAKEFVACAANPGASLILSRGAGVWHELRDNVVSVDECRPEYIAKAIGVALEEPEALRQRNLNALKRTVRINSIDRWWRQVTGSVVSEPADAFSRVSA